MTSFEHIKVKLEQFIRRYYTNELLKGTILFLAIGALYFLFTLFVEYMLWLNPTARTILFWLFIGVELSLLTRFIAQPISRLFKLQKGINYEDASKIIGDHFPEVNDKLLNVLQLKQNTLESELLLASIEQKSAELRPIPFKLAINFKNNARYLKYVAIPAIVVLISVLTGKTDWFSESYKRVVNYNIAYEPPAPFQFFVVNDNLTAIENKTYKLKVSTVGDIVPENVQIHFNDETYYLQKVSSGQFEYDFVQPKEDITFNLSANDVTSKSYSISIVKTPSLINFEMVLDFPRYTNKIGEILKSSGSTTMPEGTKVTWKVNTRATNKVTVYSNDTLHLQTDGNDKFIASRQLFNDFDYTISTSNEVLKDYENLAFSIKVIKDEYPEINIKVEKDSIDGQTLYYFGQVSDDYGISKLQLVYYPSNRENGTMFLPIKVSKSNFDTFLGSFPNQLDLEAGTDYELYFQVYDNDALHNFKSVKSQVFTYRKLTVEEEEQKQLQEQNETIKDIGKIFEKFKEQDKQLENLSKSQKEKNELNFNDKKKFENFLKRQKEQEQLMQNFNEKLKDNLEKFQNKYDETDQFKEDLKERLLENEEQLKQDEKLLEELEKLQEKIRKEEFTEKLEELAKQNKNKQRSLEQLLELTKRYYVAKKAEKLQQQLEELAKEQEKLSDQDNENNTKEEQDKLGKSFEDLLKELDGLQKENKELKTPLDIPQDKQTEEEIKKEQREASEDLEKMEENSNDVNEQQSQNNLNSAKQKQKSAAKKMKTMSDKMQLSMMSASAEQLSEDVNMLRQILDNLVLFSFEQESLMDTFKGIDIDNNQYSKYLRIQSGLREHFEHIDDSLFALSLRQPMISEQVNKQITEVFFNIDKSLYQLAENQIYQGISAQHYTVNAANSLANFLSDVLDNLEAQMNMMPGQGNGGREMQLPDIIISQEELNKQMKNGLNEGSNEKPEGESNDNNGSNPENQQSENEGQSDEELKGELYEIYQRQQQLRHALEDRLQKDGQNSSGTDLLNKMEEVELELINKGFTNETLQKMNNLHYQLLKLDKAAFIQGQDNRRQSDTNYEQFENDVNNSIPKTKDYFNSIEILNRHTLPLQQVYKRKVQDYFKKLND